MPKERPVIEVVVPVSSDGVERAARTDEELLVEEGLRFGWATTDPVIRRRLVANMAFARGATALTTSAEDESALREALALGMQRTDPVVRGRLVSRMSDLLATPSPSEQPDDARLMAYIDAHRERYEAPGRLRFTHVVLARQARGDHLAADAAALLARLRAEDATGDAAATLGDPVPLLPAHQDASVTTTDGLFGEGFGEAVAALPTGEWDGPLASGYGLHLVRVEAREGGSLPALDAIRGRVRGDYLTETRPARIARRLAKLRERYAIRVVERKNEP